MRSVFNWYLPRSTTEQWQFAYQLGMCLGWDMCRLLGDLNPRLAMVDFIGSVLLITIYIAVTRRWINSNQM